MPEAYNFIRLWHIGMILIVNSRCDHQVKQNNVVISGILAYCVSIGNNLVGKMSSSRSKQLDNETMKKADQGFCRPTGIRLLKTNACFNTIFTFFEIVSEFVYRYISTCYFFHMLPWTFYIFVNCSKCIYLS